MRQIPGHGAAAEEEIGEVPMLMESGFFCNAPLLRQAPRRGFQRSERPCTGHRTRVEQIRVQISHAECSTESVMDTPGSTILQRRGPSCQHHQGVRRAASRGTREASN